MTARRRYLVCYDIRDDARLRRVHTAMKGWGYSVQYSVFVCDLNRRELLVMKQELRVLVDHHQDSVMIVDLGRAGDAASSAFEFIGAPPPPLPQPGARVI